MTGMLGTIRHQARPILLARARLKLEVNAKAKVEAGRGKYLLCVQPQVSDLDVLMNLTGTALCHKQRRDHLDITGIAECHTTQRQKLWTSVELRTSAVELLI